MIVGMAFSHIRRVFEVAPGYFQKGALSRPQGLPAFVAKAHFGEGGSAEAGNAAGLSAIALAKADALFQYSLKKKLSFGHHDGLPPHFNFLNHVIV